MKQAKDVNSMNKKELVNLATDKLTAEYPDFDQSSFLRIQAFQDKDGRYVKFSNPVEFVPLNTCYLHGAKVRLSNLESLAVQPYENPDDYDDGNARFYRMSRDEEKQAQAILKAMDLPMSRDFSPGMTVTIIEKDSSYEVSVKTESEKTYFTLDKESGSINETLHKLLRNNDDEQRTEIVQ
jgi:hypothetical protein